MCCLEEEADPEYAKTLERLQKLQNEYAVLQSQIDEAVEGIHSNAEALQEGRSSAGADGARDGSDAFERELAKLERQLSNPTGFAKGMLRMENVVSQQAEEGGMLREVVDNLSERLAAAQLEIDGLKQQLRKAKRRQELRQLYQKMAYSDLPAYQQLQSAHLHMNRNPNHVQPMPLQVCLVLD